MKKITRRQFMAGAAGAAGIAASSASRAGAWFRPGTQALPAPGRSGIDHIIVVMMENRSFDHYLGWLPGADGRQAGLVFRDRTGNPHRTHHLTDFQNCEHPDPDHSYDGGRIQFDGGRCDVFLRSGDND
jgi:phospholipase C